MASSHWRQRSTVVICEVFRQNPGLVQHPDRWHELRKLVSKAYPFGERRMWPYKAWRAVVYEQFLALKIAHGLKVGGWEKKCPACGAKRGMPCRAMGDNRWGDPIFEHERLLADAIELGRTEEEIAAIRAEVVCHVSRNPPIESLPLFPEL